MKNSQNQVYLLLGGNLGNVRQSLETAQNLLKKALGPVLSASPIYRSEPWGFEAAEPFFNQVILIQTPMNARCILQEILAIENLLGRVREGKQYTSRSMDIDILFFNDCIINEADLTLPHPRLHLRDFTLRPLHDISPNFIHPVMGLSVAELLLQCEDTPKALLAS